MSFQNWVASYAGCDGGDPVNSKVWLVGIEWGFGNDKRLDKKEHEREMREYHSGTMVADIEGGAGSCDKEFRLSDNLYYPFGINTSKLLSATKEAVKFVIIFQL